MHVGDSKDQYDTTSDTTRNQDIQGFHDTRDLLSPKSLFLIHTFPWFQDGRWTPLLHDLHVPPSQCFQIITLKSISSGIIVHC